MMGQDQNRHLGMTTWQSLESAIEFSHKNASFHQRALDKELAEITRLKAELDKLRADE